MVKYNPYTEEFKTTEGLFPFLAKHADMRKGHGDAFDGFGAYLADRDEFKKQQFDRIWSKKLNQHKEDMEKQYLFGFDALKDKQADAEIKRQLAQFMGKFKDKDKTDKDYDDEMWNKFMRGMEQPGSEEIEKKLDQLTSLRHKGIEISHGRMGKLIAEGFIKVIGKGTYKVNKTFTQVILDQEAKNNEVIFHNGVVFKIIERDDFNNCNYVVKIGSAYAEGEGVPGVNPYE